MRTPPAEPTWRLIDWIIVPYRRPEYRRLLLWSFSLTMRLEMLSLLITVSGPFATPSLVELLRRWCDNLRAEVADFKCALRAPRLRAMAQRQSMPVRPESVAVTEFENPWV